MQGVAYYGFYIFYLKLVLKIKRKKTPNTSILYEIKITACF